MLGAMAPTCRGDGLGFRCVRGLVVGGEVSVRLRVVGEGKDRVVGFWVKGDRVSGLWVKAERVLGFWVKRERLLGFWVKRERLLVFWVKRERLIGFWVKRERLLGRGVQEAERVSGANLQASNHHQKNEKRKKGVITSRWIGRGAL